MATKVKPIPAGFRSITPMLTVREVDKAVDFYQRALGAEERMRFSGPDGSIMHAELKVGDSIIMLGSEQPEMGCRGPQTLGARRSPCTSTSRTWIRPSIARPQQMPR